MFLCHLICRWLCGQPIECPVSKLPCTLLKMKFDAILGEQCLSIEITSYLLFIFRWWDVFMKTSIIHLIHFPCYIYLSCDAHVAPWDIRHVVSDDSIYMIYMPCVVMYKPILIRVLFFRVTTTGVCYSILRCSNNIDYDSRTSARKYYYSRMFSCPQGPLLLTWTNSAPSMDKYSLWWNYLSIPKLQRCTRWN